MSTKRTYQPSKIRRIRKFGFLNRAINVLQSRRKKGRKRLTPAVKHPKFA